MDPNFDCIGIYNFPNLFSIPGGHDYLLKDIDGAVWLAAKVQFSAKPPPPPLYSVEIKQKFDISLRSYLPIRQLDICLSNMPVIYHYLVANIIP